MNRLVCQAVWQAHLKLFGCSVDQWPVTVNCRWAQDVQGSHLYEYVFAVMDELDFELLHAKVLGAESRRQMLQGAELESHLRHNGRIGEQNNG